MEKIVSVIIPAFNSEKTIVRALESIYRQTYFKYILEIIIINDGSTDRTREIVQECIEEKKYGECIHLIDQCNQGVSVSRNRGMNNAKGTWIAFLDADDEWKDDKLERQIGLIHQMQDIDMLAGHYLNTMFRIVLRPQRKAFLVNIRQMCIRSFPQPSTVLVKKSVYNQIGGFDEKQNYSEDINYFGKIASCYKFVFDPSQLVVFNGGIHPSMSSGLSANRKAMQAGVRKNLKDFKEAGYIDWPFYAAMYIWSEFKYMRRMLRRSKKHESGIIDN